MNTGQKDNQTHRETGLALRSLDLREEKSRIDALIIGDSVPIARAKKLLGEADGSNSTVLIQGVVLRPTSRAWPLSIHGERDHLNEEQLMEYFSGRITSQEARAVEWDGHYCPTCGWRLIDAGRTLTSFGIVFDCQDLIGIISIKRTSLELSLAFTFSTTICPNRRHTKSGESMDGRD